MEKDTGGVGCALMILAAGVAIALIIWANSGFPGLQ